MHHSLHWIFSFHINIPKSNARMLDFEYNSEDSVHRSKLCCQTGSCLYPGPFSRSVKTRHEASISAQTHERAQNNYLKTFRAERRNKYWVGWNTIGKNFFGNSVSIDLAGIRGKRGLLARQSGQNSDVKNVGFGDLPFKALHSTQFSPSFVSLLIKNTWVV